MVLDGLLSKPCSNPRRGRLRMHDHHPVISEERLFFFERE